MKIDRRARKTEAALKKALLELLEQKEISKITVTELVNLADINRSTFYLHYRDVYGVFEALINDAADRVINEASKFTFVNLAKNPYILLKTISDVLVKNPSFLEFIASDKSGFYTRIENTLSERFSKECLKIFPSWDKDILNLTTQYIISGVFGAFARWSRDRSVSLEVFCRQLSALIINGISSKPTDK